MQFNDFMKNTGSCVVGNLLFVYNESLDTVFLYDSALNLPLGSVADEDELLERFENIRICSICGKPMNSGYTDENSYMHSDSEFEAYMNEYYGIGKWRLATPEETERLEACYMYCDDIVDNWKTTSFFNTDWE